MAEIETDVVVVGDGPGGLSAALLLAKNGMSVDVLGPDETPTHKAMLYNYLGIEEMKGSRFVDTARDQVEDHGADLHPVEVSSLERDDGAFVATTDDGSTVRAPYAVLATGTDRSLVDPLDVERDGDAVAVDRDGATSADGLYAVGWATRPQKIQVAISVGDGAAAALDILSTEAGEPVHDFDVAD